LTTNNSKQLSGRLRRLNRWLDISIDRNLEWLVPRVNERWGCLAPAYVTAMVVLVIPVFLRWVPLWYEILDLVLIVGSAALGAVYIASLALAENRHNLELALAENDATCLSGARISACLIRTSWSGSYASCSHAKATMFKRLAPHITETGTSISTTSAKEWKGSSLSASVGPRSSFYQMRFGASQGHFRRTVK
jgi:hypothetical protein